jgi:hypothetical protein
VPHAGRSSRARTREHDQKRGSQSYALIWSAAARRCSLGTGFGVLFAKEKKGHKMGLQNHPGLREVISALRRHIGGAEGAQAGTRMIITGAWRTPSMSL